MTIVNTKVNTKVSTLTKVQQGSKLNALIRAYIKRVLADSGEVQDNFVTKQILKHLHDNKTYDSTKLLFCPEAGIKLRESGVNFYVPKIYDLAAGDGVNQDGTQTTESNQPYLSGNIAPNEKLSLKGNSFDNRLLTHQDISFADSLPFSFTFVANPIGSNTSGNYDYYAFGGITFGHRNDGLLFFVYNGNSLLTYYTANIYKQIKKGKTNIYTIVVENRRLELYVNNIHIGYLTREDSSVVFNMLRTSQSEVTGVRCSCFYHRIQSGAMTSEQVSAEYTFLRSLYPEIPSVQIGTEDIATSSLEMVVSTNGTIITQAADNADWATGAARWCYHNADSAVGAIYGKLYNKAARDVIIANPPSGWHVATEAELTALALNGGNALKFAGTDYWNTTGGTNSTGFTALGSSSRNADGSFNAIKDHAGFWCADSDKVLKVYHNNDTAEVVAVTSVNEGFSIRLVKD